MGMGNDERIKACVCGCNTLTTTQHYKPKVQYPTPKVRVPSYIMQEQQGYLPTSHCSTGAIPMKTRATMRGYIAVGNVRMRDMLLSEWIRKYGRDKAMRTYGLDHGRAKDCTRSTSLRMAKERYVSHDKWDGYTKQLYTVPRPMAGQVYNIN